MPIAAPISTNETGSLALTKLRISICRGDSGRSLMGFTLAHFWAALDVSSVSLRPEKWHLRRHGKSHVVSEL